MSGVFNVELRLILSSMLLVLLVDHYQGHGHGLSSGAAKSIGLAALALASFGDTGRVDDGQTNSVLFD